VSEKLRGRFAGAAGLLAVRSGDSLPINFASPRQPKAAADPTRRKLMLVALAALAFIIAGGGFGYLEFLKANRRLNNAVARKTVLENELKAREPDAKRLAAAEQWSNRGVNYLDEMFEMASRLPDGDQLRVSEFKGTARPVDKKGQQDAQATFEIRGGVKLGSAITALSDKIESNAGKEKNYIGTQISRPGLTIPNTAYSLPFVITTKVNRREPWEYTGAPFFNPPVRRTASAAPPSPPPSQPSGGGGSPWRTGEREEKGGVEERPRSGERDRGKEKGRPSGNE
jgi:hypothetical protein